MANERTVTARRDVRGVRASWWYSASSLLLLVLVLHAVPAVAVSLRPESADLPVALRVLAVTALAASAVMQCAIVTRLRAGLGSGATSPPVHIAALVVGAAVYVVVPGTMGSGLPVTLALGLTACLLPARRRSTVVGAAMLVGAATALLPRNEAGGWWDLTFGIGTPVMVWSTVWAWDVVARLDAARGVETDLAVTRERLRFASDLHDAQGHSLQVIALKAELAERLVAADPAAAAEQIRDVREQAADALARTREIVHGYRSPGLREELDNAVDVLGAAGFDCVTDVAAAPEDAQVRAVLGRALREATTNVLRHAAPGPVEITVTGPGGAARWILRVANAAPVVPWADPRGSGIAGLRELVGRAGGEVRAGRDDDEDGRSRFVFEASVPDRVDETASAGRAGAGVSA